MVHFFIDVSMLTGIFDRRGAVPDKATEKLQSLFDQQRETLLEVKCERKELCDKLGLVALFYSCMKIYVLISLEFHDLRYLVDEEFFLFSGKVQIYLYE